MVVYLAILYTLNVFPLSLSLSLSLVKSIIDYPLPNASIQTGSNISYICYSSTANGIDVPLIRWGKDGVLLNRSLERYSFEQDRYGVSTLSIANVTVEDGGTFSCRVNNSVSSASMEARLIVVGE